MKISLTADLCEPLVELINLKEAPIQGVEVGPWFSAERIRAERLRLCELPFYFHGADLIEQAGLVPGASSRIAAYQASSAGPWISFHLSLWLPGMVGLMLRRGWHMPKPNFGWAARRLAGQVKRLSQTLGVPVILENKDPLPFKGYEFEVIPELIRQVLAMAECGFLLDTGHARLAAEALGMDVKDYLNQLPYGRVWQVHASGPRMHSGRLMDALQPLLDVDYEILDYVLERSRPQVVTLEYIREREGLKEQLLHLREILDRFKQ